jgi:hypothetical protein
MTTRRVFRALALAIAVTITLGARAVQMACIIRIPIALAFRRIEPRDRGL